MAPPRIKSKSGKQKPTGKPDLLHVLERRRRTVESFLEERGVKTRKEWSALRKSLEVEYDLSDELLAMVNRLLPKPVVVAVEEPVNASTGAIAEEEKTKTPKRQKKSFEKLD